MSGLDAYVIRFQADRQTGMRLWRWGTAALIAAVLICMGGVPVDAAAVSGVTQIARYGDTAPLSGGQTFDGFDEPMVNANGDVTFVGFLSGGGAGVYLMPVGGSLTKIAEDGDTVDGATLTTDFDGPAINDDGTVFFVNRGMTGAFANALFAKAVGGSLASIIRQGDPAPGTNAGVFETFDDMGVNPRKGDIAVIASYTEDGGSTFKIGVWLRILKNKKKGKTQLVAIVRSGDTLPGTDGGTVANSSDPEDIDGPWVGDNRLVVFAVDSIDSGNTAEEGSLFARRTKGKIKPVVLMTDTPPAELGGTISSIGVGRPGLVKNKIAVNLEVDGGFTTAGIITKRVGSKTEKAKVCVANGQPAPGTIGTFSMTDGVSAPTFNKFGDVEFHSQVDGDANDFAGEFVCKTKGKAKGTIVPVVLTNDPKPVSGAWQNPEEGSSSANFITFLDDTGGSEDGVFLTSMP